MNRHAFQTEEENPAGANAYAVDIEDSRDLLFANTYMYRVSRNVLPKTYAILTRRSDGIAFENMKVLAIANERAVYRLCSTTPGAAEPVAETAEALPQTTLLPPVGLHNQLSVMHDMMERRGYVYRPRSNTLIVSAVPNEHRGYYYAPGTRTAIMAGGTWRPNLQSSQLAPFLPGTSHYLTSEDDGRTCRVTLEADGKLSSTISAERGGTAVVTDAAGNVYIAGSEVWIHDRNGKPLGVLEVPERPGSLAVGGPDRRTLYRGAHLSLLDPHENGRTLNSLPLARP